MSNMTNQVKMQLSNDVWITEIEHLGVQMVSMASDIRVSLRGLQDSITYVEDGCGRRLLEAEQS